MNLDIKNLSGKYPAIGHDSASLGIDLAKAVDGYDDLKDFQKDGRIALYTTKVLLIALERAGLVTEEMLEKNKVRDIIWEMREELGDELK